MFPYFDTHAHYQDEDFAEDREAVLGELAGAGVARVVLASSDLADSRKAAELALSRPGLFCVLGVHPHEAKSWNADSAAALRALIQETQERGRVLGREKVVVGIGEIGLDYHYDFSPRDVQAAVYRRQIELAHDLKLPFVIHEREAFLDSFTILEEAAQEGLLSYGFSCHCFSGSPESARRLLALGAYIGFDGPITFKNAKKPAAVTAMLPADRFLTETDSPYLAPEPLRGHRNDSRNLQYIVDKAAQLRQTDAAAIRAQAWENACRFYQLPLDSTHEVLPRYQGV